VKIVYYTRKSKSYNLKQSARASSYLAGKAQAYQKFSAAAIMASMRSRYDKDFHTALWQLPRSTVDFRNLVWDIRSWRGLVCLSHNPPLDTASRDIEDWHGKSNATEGLAVERAEESRETQCNAVNHELIRWKRHDTAVGPLMRICPVGLCDAAYVIWLHAA